MNNQSSIPKLALTIGGILIAVGIIAYIISGASSVTALIPSFLGLLIALCGFIGQRSESARKHAMHAAAVLSLLGAFGSIQGFIGFFSLIAGASVDLPYAVVAQFVTTVLCVIFIVAAVRSFINARRSRA